MEATHPHSVRQRPSWRAGFTLVEVIVAFVIFGIVIAGVMAVFIGTLKSTRATSDAIDFNARSRFIQERLLFDLRAVTEVTAINTALNSAEVAKIFADYNGSEVTNCFRSFTAKINEFSGADDIQVTYEIVDAGSTPSGQPLKKLQRRIGTRTQTVLANLQDGCFTFYTRKKSTGTLTSLPAGSAADVNAVRFAFLPQGRPPLVPGKNDPSCSAVVQLRYPSYK